MDRTAQIVQLTEFVTQELNNMLIGDFCEAYNIPNEHLPQMTIRELIDVAVSVELTNLHK